MATQIQPELLPKNDPNWKAPDALAVVTTLSLMQFALERGQVEQLQILQDMHFKQLERDAEAEFNLAMNAVQSELGRVAANMNNVQTKSKYADYAALDRAIRPIYTKHGFSLSFDSGESLPETVVAYCYVSHRAGHTRKYQSPAMPLPVMGPQGKAVMTATHGTGAAMSYAMRYLLKFIFNIAIGEDDTDGNTSKQSAGGSGQMDQKEAQERYDYFKKCETFQELQEHWLASRGEAKKFGDQKAVEAFDYAKNQRKEELRKAGAK